MGLFAIGQLVPPLGASYAPGRRFNSGDGPIPSSQPDREAVVVMEAPSMQEFIQAERDRREREGREQLTRACQDAVRVACMSCQQFDSGLGALSVDGAGQDLPEQAQLLLMCERHHEFDPVTHRDPWPQVNLNCSRAWIRRWGPLAAALRDLGMPVCEDQEDGHGW